MKRRRFIQIAASSVGGVLAGTLRGQALPPDLLRADWSGVLLGTEGAITLFAAEPVDWAALHAKIRTAIVEIESALSLYHPDSELVRLNRDGALDHPSATFRHAVELAGRIHAETRGAFDPTVQPLYALYRDHFRADSDRPEGPSAAVVEATLARVGWEHLEAATDRIQFSNAGMSLTFNGLAQGIATDRVTEILAEAGFAHALVRMGETRALGRHPRGRPWNIALADADGVSVPLDGRALATSSPGGTPFDRAGRFHHLLDPRSGYPVSSYQSLSIVAETAAVADGYSTALAVMSPEEVEGCLTAHPELEIHAKSWS